jgi:hypothetical protein
MEQNGMLTKGNFKIKDETLTTLRTLAGESPKISSQNMSADLSLCLKNTKGTV